jgi:DNA-binding XRE family transcriptional regulator
MNNSRLIPWQEVRDKYLTKDEQILSELRAKLKIAIRKLKEQRKYLKVTQIKLAQKAGIPRTTLTKIESGYQNVSILKLMTVADAMDMDLEIQLVKRK